MKDFHGNYHNVNPKLDTDNAYMIYNNIVDDTKVQREYTPEKDGVIIITCSYKKGAKVYLVVKYQVSPTVISKKLGSVVQTANSDGVDNQVMTIPVKAGDTCMVYGNNFSAEYIPYK